MLKKTNKKPALKGGVLKDPEVRVKIKTPKPTSTELVVRADPKKIKKISKLNTKNMRSIVGDNAEVIQQLLESDNNESAIPLIHKKLLQSLVDLIPMAETAVRKSKGARGVYQINSLISSIRELMTDIQSAQDRGMLGDALVEQIIKPTYADMATDIVQEYSLIAADAKAAMSKEEWLSFSASLKTSRARLADKITGHFRTVREGTRTFLQR